MVDKKVLSKEEEFLKHQQDALFREVDEQVRLENMKKFWKKHGNTFIGIVLVIIVAVGGVELYKKIKKDKAYQVSNDYLTALMLISDGKNADAIASFERIVKEDKNGLADFAKLYIANLEAKNPDKYLEITSDKKVFEPLKDFVTLSYAYKMVDSKSETEMFEIIKPFENKNEFKGAVMEIKALTYLKANKIDEATKILDNMQLDANVASAFKARAKKLLQTVKK